MNKTELKAVRDSLGLNISDMAHILMVSRGGYVKWERGERKIPEIVDLAILWIETNILSWVNIYNRRTAVSKSDKSPESKRILAERFSCSVSAINSDIRHITRNEISRPQWGHIYTDVTKKQVKDIDGYHCAYCGAKDCALETDHIVPVCQGGRDHFCNMITSCKECNRAKLGKNVDEWLQK